MEDGEGELQVAGPEGDDVEAFEQLAFTTVYGIGDSEHVSDEVPEVGSLF